MSGQGGQGGRAPLRGRGAYRAWRSVPTRWMDNDVYGHVNNVVYYSFFDTAVNAWLVEQGLLDIDRGSIIGLVVETGCTYARPIAFPEEVQAGLAVSRIGTSSVRYEIGLFAAGAAEPAAQGFFVHVHVDRQTRRPVPLPESWRQALAALTMA
ncbi:MAG: acyl-CoA thioesterase [Sphingomonadaceae bacterium]